MKLQYCLAPDRASTFISEVVGDKVFPVWDRIEVDYLRSLAKLYGVETQEVEWKHRSCSERVLLGTTGTVACLDEDLLPAAILYAELTDRAVTVVQGVRGLVDTLMQSNIEVLVFRYSRWTVDLAQALQPFTLEHKARPVGLIPGIDLEDAYRQCVRRAAALQLSFVCRDFGKNDCVEILPDVNLSAAMAGGALLLGRNAPAALVQSRLAAGASLLALSTHSDGLDSPLPAGRVMCGLKGRTRKFGRVRPICVVSGECHRLGHAPLEVALASDKLVPPASLKAKLIYYRACYVLFPDRGGIEPADTLGAAILSDSVFGCLITSVEVIFSETLQVHQEALLIKHSANVGDAMRRIAEAYADHPKCPRLFCFGDPRLLIEAASASDSVSAGSIRVGIKRSKGADWPSDMSAKAHIQVSSLFLEGMHDSAVKGIADLERRHVVEAIWKSAKDAASFVNEQPATASPDNLRRFDDRLARCLPFLRQEVPSAWVNGGAAWRTWREATCPHCGAFAQGLKCEFEQFSVRRIIINCPSCGIAQDRPEGFDVKLRISSDGMVTMAADFSPAVGARFFVRTHIHRPTGPMLEEVDVKVFCTGYQLRSPLGLPMPAQVSIFSLHQGIFAFDGRNVILPQGATT